MHEDNEMLMGIEVRILCIISIQFISGIRFSMDLRPWFQIYSENCNKQLRTSFLIPTSL